MIDEELRSPGEEEERARRSMEKEQKRPRVDMFNRRGIRQAEGESFCSLFERLHGQLIGYYGSWTHDAPMVITHARDEEMRRIAQVLYKACAYYAEHYREFLDLINYPPRVLELLDYVSGSGRPFRAGTWRPDVLYGADGSLQVCEITSRFFGNGYFLSYFNNAVGAQMAERAGITDRRDYMEEMLAHFAGMLGDAGDPAAGDGSGRRLCVLTSADKSDSIALYMPFYSALGMQPVLIWVEELMQTARAAFCSAVPGHTGGENEETTEASGCIGGGEKEEDLRVLREMFPEGCAIVSALNQNDLLALPQEMLHYLTDRGMINDFRTIFLLHDKRFFRLFAEPRFTDAFLTKEEARFLREHTVRTWLPEADPEMFEAARLNPEGYILKHHCLGKSERVYAGCLTPREEWERIFAGEELGEMILQPFVSQKVCTTSWKGGTLRDYAVGTLLTLDDRYFGPGFVRTSTQPVINQTDAHKISPVVTDEGEKFGNCYLL